MLKIGAKHSPTREISNVKLSTSTMGELEATEKDLEFFSASARAGRRNALPQLEIEISDPDGAKLAERLSDMSANCETEQQKTNTPGPSPQQPANS
ncbi:unnamed protein product [Caenorhabditis bovis]|uniref:cAMP-dependent protein kinase inhibitor n=1 Tax=Caenorhabditis bovis TaxID=2654633 RepID=A0A8S1FF65_9PELO|nr:unnamed protein product [Caenorhabditis bovis]